MHLHALDSTRWNDFEFRNDDIVIASWGKSGTTWVQQIVGQLIFKGREDISVTDLAPWLEMPAVPKDEVFAMLEAQTHRRFIKTHLPVDALVFSPQAKYLYVARDGRDALWSFYNTHSHGNRLFYRSLNAKSGYQGAPIEPPPDDVRQYFHDWLEKDGFPWWPFWSHVQSWWDIRRLPNVMLLHFNNLKADMPGEIRQIAEFLNIEIEENTWPSIVEHCGFDYMKAHAAETVPFANLIFDGGAQTFINKGINGRWRDVLTAEDNKKYQDHAERNLSPDCAHWLATGELPEDRQ
jgi:aryl sulfotransferase